MEILDSWGGTSIAYALDLRETLLKHMSCNARVKYSLDQMLIDRPVNQGDEINFGQNGDEQHTFLPTRYYESALLCESRKCCFHIMLG